MKNDIYENLEETRFVKVPSNYVYNQDIVQPVY